MLDFFSRDPKKIVEKCQKLRLEGKYDKAEETLKKNIKNKKEDYIFLLELARVQFEQNKLPESVLSVKNAYFMRSEKIDEIINVLEDFHFKAADKIDTGALLIELYIKKRDAQKIQKIIDTFSKDESEKLVENFKTKVGAIKEARNFEQFTKKDIEIFLMAGIMLLKTNQYDEARDLFTIPFKKQPSDRNFILEEYLAATKFNYSNPDPYIHIGDFYLLMDDKDKAITYFQKAIKINPDKKEEIASKLDDTITDTQNISKDSKLSLADVYINKGDYSKAVSIMREIIEEEPADAKNILRRTREITEKDDSITEAYKLITDITMIQRDYEQAATNLIRVFNKDKSALDWILQRISKIRENDFDNNDLTILESGILIEKEQFDKAGRQLADLYEEDKGSAFEIEEYVNKLLEHDETNLTGLDLLLSIYYNRGQPDKSMVLLEYVFSLEGDHYSEIAEKHYRKLNEKYPENTDFLLGYALALIRNRKISESKSVIMKAVSRQTAILYDLIPAFYEPASESSEIAAGILDIIKAIDRDSIDPFLYDYTLTETLYLAGNIKDSIDNIVRMLENYPDKEDAIMEIGERLSKRYPDNTNILEFKFKYHIAKENFDKALQSTMQLYENKDLIGHVLDNLYVLYRHQPDNYEIIKNILIVLDEMGMYERIISESDDFIENIPDEKSGVVRYYIGKSYAKKGKVDDAASYIFQAITLDNSIIDEAITILKEALDVDYSSIRLHYALAHAYNNNNMISEAVDELMNIYQLDNSQIDTVTRDLLNFYETNRSNPKITFGLGRLFLISREYHKAVQKFKETYELDNSFIEPILNRLSSLQENENIESGEVLYLMGVLYFEKNMPKMSADYLYNAMSIETDLKQPVLNQLRKIINTHPDDIYARFSLAQIYIEMANYVQAIQILRQIETIDPKESNNVIEYYNTMLAKEPDNPVILMSMADSYLQMGEIDRAVDVFNKTLSIDKSQIDGVLETLLEFPDKNIDIQLFLSDLYKEKGDYSSAVNWLNAVYISDFSKHGIIRDKLNDLLEQYPNESNALMLLSKIYYNLDNYEKLIELSHNIFDRSENPEMKFRSGMLLAQAYRKTDNEEKASDIIYRMKQENRELFYTVLVQFYEEEKSSRIYRLKEQFSKNKEKEEIRLEYAKYLIVQNNFDKARELLSHRFGKKELDFDRLYYLGKISEKSNNLIFALQIASNLRHSKKVEHISFLINLFKKMGYYGEIDSLLNEHKELSLSVNRNNISSNVFTEYKIIT